MPRKQTNLEADSGPVILRFAFGVVLLAPLTFGFWWYCWMDASQPLLWKMIDLCARWLQVQHVVEIQFQAGQLLAVTSLEEAENPFHIALIKVPFEQFTACFPLLWALLLATPQSERFFNMVFGTLALFPLIVLMVLLWLQFQIGYLINQQSFGTEPTLKDYYLALPYSQSAYYAMRVGRNLALLVMPMASPILLWMLFNLNHFRAIQAHRKPTQVTTP